MKSKGLVFAVVALMACSFAAAEKINVDMSAKGPVLAEGQTRTNGSMGSFSVTVSQTGPLTVDMDLGCTTQGGDGIAQTPTWYPTIGPLQDQVRLLGALYSVSGTALGFLSTDRTYYENSPTALGNFSTSYTFTVPAVGDYMVFANFVAGNTWPTTGFSWGSITQVAATGFYVYPTYTSYIGLGYYGNFYYIDDTQPPTPTFNPDAGGLPVPSMNAWGVAAMIVLLIGVAMLIITRRQ